MKPYYQDSQSDTIYCGDSKIVLPELPSDSVDLLATDPPYGISFMGKEWDKALPDIKIWQECLRVLKPGALAFVMCIPRQDCLSRMIISLEDAGFMVNFAPIFWAYASGFPKAQNISLTIDKQECRKQLTEKLGRKPTKEEFDEAWKEFREIVGHYVAPDGIWRDCGNHKPNEEIRNPDTHYGYKTSGFRPIDTPTTPQAKALDGSYAGFQPKPAVEVIIVAMKPLSEKTYVDQALKNGKGITWLDDGRIPYESEEDKEGARFGTQMDIKGGNLKTPQGVYGKNILSSQSGRFPANLLVSDDVLNDGREHTSGRLLTQHKRSANSLQGTNTFKIRERTGEFANWGGDSGAFSRYFDLDKWAQKTFPFLIVPKASKSEKNRGCEDLPSQISNTHKGHYRICKLCGKRAMSGTKEQPQYRCQCPEPKWEYVESNGKSYVVKNNHPTVKPLKLISYLITLGSREGDVVLDPFVGSGTTDVACHLLGRRFVGIDTEAKYCEITVRRSQGILNLM